MQVGLSRRHCWNIGRSVIISQLCSLIQKTTIGDLGGRSPVSYHGHIAPRSAFAHLRKPYLSVLHMKRTCQRLQNYMMPSLPARHFTVCATKSAGIIYLLMFEVRSSTFMTGWRSRVIFSMITSPVA